MVSQKLKNCTVICSINFERFSLSYLCSFFPKTLNAFSQNEQFLKASQDFGIKLTVKDKNSPIFLECKVYLKIVIQSLCLKIDPYKELFPLCVLQPLREFLKDIFSKYLMSLCLPRELNFTGLAQNSKFNSRKILFVNFGLTFWISTEIIGNF